MIAMLDRGYVWSFVIYERPILGDNPKPHNFAWWKALCFSWKLGLSHGKCNAFHEKREKCRFSYERPFARNCNLMFWYTWSTSIQFLHMPHNSANHTGFYFLLPGPSVNNQCCSRMTCQCLRALCDNRGQHLA